MMDMLLHILLAIRVLESWPQVLMSLLFIVLLVVMWMQWKAGRQLKSELAVLGKMGKHNVEYEFVLGTMKLSIWHLDVKTGKLTFAAGAKVSVLDPENLEKDGGTLVVAEAAGGIEGEPVLDNLDNRWFVLVRGKELRFGYASGTKILIR